MSSDEQVVLFEIEVIKQLQKRFDRLIDDSQDLHARAAALAPTDPAAAAALRAKMHENLAQLEALRDRLKRLNAWYGGS